MESDKVLSIASYGMGLFSLKKMESFRKENKIRSKKLLQYFKKNHETYLASIKEGAWLPIPIDSINYVLKISNNGESFSDNWKLVNENKGFNLEIGEDATMWICSSGGLNEYNAALFEENVNSLSYQTLDGNTLYNAFKFPLKQGKYMVDILGYQNKTQNDSNTSQGFLFTFSEVHHFDNCNDPREDKYSFVIR